MNFRFLLSSLLMVLLLVPGVTPAWADNGPRRTLNVKVGGTGFLDTTHAVKRASVVNPEIADIVIISPKELYAYGKQPGYTTVILWEEGRDRSLLDVVVSLDLTALKERIHGLFPNEQIEVHGSETGVVLSGTVSGPEVVEQVLRLARTFMPRLAEAADAGPGTGVSGGGITNLMRVGGVQQVMLEVKFAEVTRSSGKDWQAGFGLDKLGSDFQGAFGVGNVFTPIEDAFIFANFPNAPKQAGIFEGAIDGLIQNPSSLLVNFAGNPANMFMQINNFKMALNMLETEGLARILAEPRLVTQSGKEASFLAGGEFPIPVSTGLNEISIEFKEFGVALRFTPIVLADGKISLRVAPSVSQIASTSSIPAGIVGTNFIVPNLATRKLDTTVELHDGQTLALAGLLQDDLREQVNKVPGLGNLPILGQLFRSTSYQQQKTDLLIAVTPHLVKPVREGELRFPGENFRPPNAYEFYIEGRLEGRRTADAPAGLSRHEFAPPAVETRRGGLEGAFGYQPLATQHKEAVQ
ncbi:type II and III secretion system protein family protein [Geoalkalibacter halelectricus]|uniref:Type II and III secretion system protein family protein n=1 Tax=Geoalkalibacter halelectricus TaxID=2847045 RepID=A0ABY5ZM60_9BACT|nr:type II and III secretion system protein family protein [Geoalkalibacter halelectricus]MDO3378428.1 type II and III secretion system protein family protein [Geoalkalibacter halelectricus]UWZ80252.1 type II and III secretion system protein family protein [Geoalkalibacter halelectricus]